MCIDLENLFFNNPPHTFTLHTHTRTFTHTHLHTQKNTRAGACFTRFALSLEAFAKNGRPFEGK